MIHTKAIRDLALARCSRSPYHTPPDVYPLPGDPCPECPGTWGTSKAHPKGFTLDHGGRWIAVYRDSIADPYEEGELIARLFGPLGVTHLPPKFLQGAQFDQESWLAGFHSVVPKDLSK